MSGPDPIPAWRQMTPADLAHVDRIAGVVHAALPERPEVAAERLRLFPAGCSIADAGPGGEAVGYALAHPARLAAPPKLDTLLGALPADADCLYLHDVALLPAARRFRLGSALVDRLAALARRCGLPALGLISVYDSRPFWLRHGFAVMDAPPATLASYGDEAACLMRRPL